MTRTATIRRGRIKTSDSHAPIEQAGKPVDERLASMLPSEMSTAQLRTLLKANGIAYSGKDRKADLVFKAQKLRYGPNERQGAAVAEPSSDPVEAIAAAVISGEVSFLGAVEEMLDGPALPEAPQAIEVVDGKTRNARIAAAKEEHAALKAWASARNRGERDALVADRPATPNLDAIEAEAKHSGPKPTKARSSGSGAKRQATQVTVRFLIDGKPVGDTQNRLSAISRVTAGIETPDAPRWPAPELRSWLASRGISDPENTEWSVPLPNGRTIGAKLSA